MTKKTLKVGIASYGEMKERTLGIARGELRPAPDEPKVWFTSTESFAKVLSDKNRALLAEIAAGAPASLAELATRTGRQKSNLSRTLKTLERYGFVPLRRGERGRIIPEVPYEEIVLTLPLHRTPGRVPEAAQQPTPYRADDWDPSVSSATRLKKSARRSGAARPGQ